MKKRLIQIREKIDYTLLSYVPIVIVITFAISISLSILISANRYDHVYPEKEYELLEEIALTSINFENKTINFPLLPDNIEREITTLEDTIILKVKCIEVHPFTFNPAHYYTITLSNNFEIISQGRNFDIDSYEKTKIIDAVVTTIILALLFEFLIFIIIFSPIFFRKNYRKKEETIKDKGFT